MWNDQFLPDAWVGTQMDEHFCPLAQFVRSQLLAPCVVTVTGDYLGIDNRCYEDVPEWWAQVVHEVDGLEDVDGDGVVTAADFRLILANQV